MFKKSYFCVYLIGATIIMILFSYLFNGTEGLLYITDNINEAIAIKYVSELLSSGAEDNMIIGLFDWFYIPIIILYAYKCYMTKFILSTYFLIISLQLFSFMLLDIGSIYETIIYGKNLILFIWFISYFMVISISMYGFLNYKNISQKRSKNVYRNNK